MAPGMLPTQEQGVFPWRAPCGPHKTEWSLPQHHQHFESIPRQ